MTEPETSNLSVEHFRSVLDNESKNLSQLCDRWSQVLEENNLSNDIIEEQKQHEDFLGAIRSTIGQAKLLMSQRFKQFSDLIDNCEFNTGKLPTRLNDLSGFWEMIKYQVDDVLGKFKHLEQQHSNNIDDNN